MRLLHGKVTEHMCCMATSWKIVTLQHCALLLYKLYATVKSEVMEKRNIKKCIYLTYQLLFLVSVVEVDFERLRMRDANYSKIEM